MASALGSWAGREYDVEISIELTDKQAEALMEARRVGFFDGPPRNGTSAEFAEGLGISTGSASRRVRSAEHRLVRAFIEELMGKYGCPLCGASLVVARGREGKLTPLRDHLPECPERDLGLDEPEVA